MFRCVLIPLTLVLALVAAACGADDFVDDVTDAAAPIPVEPDGGIGDGAAPLPLPTAAPDVPTAADQWHGFDLATTNCPGTEFQPVEASAFTFWVPGDLADKQAQGFDSEVAVWANGQLEVSYDLGWYSGPLDTYTGAQVSDVDYSGRQGHLAIIDAADAPNQRHFVGVHLRRVLDDGSGEATNLNLIVQYDDPVNEIIARCIVGSIEWR